MRNQRYTIRGIAFFKFMFHVLISPLLVLGALPTCHGLLQVCFTSCLSRRLTVGGARVACDATKKDASRIYYLVSEVLGIEINRDWFTSSISGSLLSASKKSPFICSVDTCVQIQIAPTKKLAFPSRRFRTKSFVIIEKHQAKLIDKFYVGSKRRIVRFRRSTCESSDSG